LPLPPLEEEEELDLVFPVVPLLLEEELEEDDLELPTEPDDLEDELPVLLPEDTPPRLELLLDELALPTEPLLEELLELDLE
jgi:hypothetical protein